MQFVFAYLLGAFVLGGTGIGRWLRERPFLLMVVAAAAAASFFSLKVAV